MKIKLALLVAIGLCAGVSAQSSSTYIRNRDLVLRSTSTKKGRAEDIYQEVRIHLRSKVGSQYRPVTGELMVIYKMPTKGGVYTYVQHKLNIDFDGTSDWKRLIKVPHKYKMTFKYDHEDEAGKKDIKYYDYVILIHTKDRTPLVFSTKSSWKRVIPALRELGALKPFSSSGKKVTKLEKKLTPQEEKALRLKRNKK